MKFRNLPICLAAAILLLHSCSDPKPEPAPGPKNEEPVEVEEPPAPKLSEFTPLKIEGGYLPLTPRTHTEADLDELIKSIEIKLRGPGFQKMSFDLHYGVELNLNPGPSGSRFTYEGSKLELDLHTVQLKDGTTVEIEDPYGTSQNWSAAGNRFNDSREISVKGDIKRDALDKATGDIVLTLAADIQPIEFTRPEDTKKITTQPLPIDGFSAIPFWDQRRLAIRFGETGNPAQVVHVRGIDETGQELKIVSFGNTLPGERSYTFEDNGKIIQTIHLFIAPKIVERRLPFDLKMPE